MATPTARTRLLSPLGTLLRSAQTSTLNARHARRFTHTRTIHDGPVDLARIHPKSVSQHLILLRDTLHLVRNGPRYPWMWREIRRRNKRLREATALNHERVRAQSAKVTTLIRLMEKEYGMQEDLNVLQDLHERISGEGGCILSRAISTYRAHAESTGQDVDDLFDDLTNE